MNEGYLRLVLLGIIFAMSMLVFTRLIITPNDIADLISGVIFGSISIIAFGTRLYTALKEKE